MQLTQDLIDVAEKVLMEATHKIITPDLFDEAYGPVLEPIMFNATKNFIFPRKVGKRLRPSIVLSTAQAYLPIVENPGRYAAFSIEVDHNRYLIHDDIEDNSRVRRGEPCLYITHGVDKAINFGDRLEAVAQRAIELEFEKGLIDAKAFTRLSGARREQVQATTEGQNYEFLIRKKPISEATEADVIKILENKTGTYTINAPIEYGMIRANEPLFGDFRNAAIKIGVGFQIKDDYLDLEGKLTKDWAGDLEEGKRTLILVRGYEAASTEEKEYIDRWVGNELQRDNLSPEKKTEVKENIRNILRKYGVLEEAKQEAEEMASEGIDVFKTMLPNNEGAQKLIALLSYAVLRGK